MLAFLLYTETAADFSCFIVEIVYDMLFVIIELVSPALTVEALQGKTCQDSLLSGGVGQFEPRFQGKGIVSGKYFWLLQN